MTKQDLQGRAAIVTGAAGGIGQAIAKELVARGARVTIADLRESEGASAAAALAGDRAAARFQRLDVRDEASWRAVVAGTVEAFGGFDILVGNAGVEMTTTIADCEPDALRALFDVNVSGVLLGLQAAFRAMRPGGLAGRGGVVVNVGSLASQTALPLTGPYAASKSAVERLTKIGAVEAGRFGYGVRVNCVHPGFVPTTLSAESVDAAVALGAFADRAAHAAFVTEQTPLGRLGAPEDVAEAVAFLCSDSAAFVTGASLAVTGGLALA